MGKRLSYTTNSQIRSALRQLFLRSRERSARIKQDGYICQCCGKKQSKAKGKEVKVEVHHQEGVLNWQLMFETIREYVLCDPRYLETLCEKCHKDKTKEVS